MFWIVTFDDSLDLPYIFYNPRFAGNAIEGMCFAPSGRYYGIGAIPLNKVGTIEKV